MPIVLIINILWWTLILAVLVQIVMGSKDSDVKLVWMLLVVLLPMVGLVFYCLFGIHYRRQEVFDRFHAANLERFGRQISPELASRLFPDGLPDGFPEQYRPLARLLRSCGDGNRVYGGNSFELITSGLRKRELLLEDIRQAKHSIHIEYFRFGNDKAGREVRDLLYQKVAEGVQVRFLNNNMIGRNIPRRYFRDMVSHGMEVIPYTHIRHGWRSWLMRLNCQNHRKIVVIDGRIAFTGGMNLNDNYFYIWRDTHLRITGPVVARLQASFMDSWMGTGGRFNEPLAAYFTLPEPPSPAPSAAPLFHGKTLQAVADAPEYPWPTTQLGYEWVLQNARSYVYIQTPYFLPPSPVMDALKSAALRGVDVRLMVPKKVDTIFIGPANRSCYEECLAAGIRIYELGGEFTHSKTMVSDDGLSLVGATNLDYRSFHLDTEFNCFIYDEEAARYGKEIFLTHAAEATERHLDEWRASRKWHQKFLERLMRLGFRML